MTEAHFWILIVGLILAAWGGVAAWARHLSQSKRLEVRRMIHRERMAALERGLDLSELSDDLAHPAAGEGASGDGASSRWVQRSSLAAGLALVFIGLGIYLGLAGVPDTPELGDLRDMASLGVVPVFAGIGVLLFWWLDRRAGRGGAR